MNIVDTLSKDGITNLIKIFNFQIAIGIIVFAFITKSIFAKAVINIFYKIFKKEGKAKESGMYTPLKWIYVAIGIFIAIRILPIETRYWEMAKTIFKICIIIFIAQIVNNAILVKDSIFFKKRKTNSSNETINLFIFRILKVVVWIIAVYIIFLMLDIDLSGLVTGLGIGTVIISLAAQDTVKSLLSGVSILSDKPFVLGDWITVGSYSGTVVNITFRSTRIKCADNSFVTIPNSTVTENSVVNWSNIKARRIDYTLNLEMGTPIEKIEKLVKELKVVISSKDYVKADSVYVGFSAISSYSSDITIFFNVTETNYAKYLDLKQEINCEILKILNKENIELAYPTETVHVKNIDEKGKTK